MNSPNIQLVLNLLPLEFCYTFYMVFVSTFIAVLIGLPLGVILTISDKGHIKENPGLYKILSILINIGRSFPFAILMIALIPFTRWLVGTSLGTTASIVPLSIAAIPFLARLIETSLKEVEAPLLEAAIVMGSKPSEIIKKILIPESYPRMIQAVTLTAINLVGYSAMAGLVGGGGLGQVAIHYGYHRFNVFIMIVTVILLIVFVQCLQWLGGYIARSIARKRGILLYD